MAYLATLDDFLIFVKISARLVFGCLRKEGKHELNQQVDVLNLLQHRDFSLSSHRHSMDRQQMEIISQSKRIEGDLIQDLMMQLNTAKSENSIIASQQFIAGVVAATKNPDHYSEIWHAGYDSGMNNSSKLAASSEKESTYTGYTE